MEAETDYRCQHCNRVFRRTSTLEAHMCEQRRRVLNRGDRGVQIGFQAFLEFYRSMHGSSQLKTIEDFETSAYYRAFVRFGHYCVNTRVVDPHAYMSYLLSHNRKIDHWARDQEYTTFLTDWLPRESAAQAMTRTIEWAETWAQQNQSLPQHCLRYGNVHALCHAIVSGRVSGWVIFNCDSGQAFLESLKPADIEIIWPYINSDHWQRTFRNHPADQLWCQQQLESAGW